MSIGRLISYGILALILFQLVWRSSGIRVPEGSILDESLGFQVLRSQSAEDGSENGHTNSNAALRDLLGKPMGSQVHLKDFAGQTLLMTFWASWCPACQSELASMIELARKFPKLRVIAVNLDENPLAALAKVEQQFGVLPFYHVLDPGNITGQKLGVRVLPTNLLVSSNLKLVWATGAQNWMAESVRKKIAAELGP